LGSSPKAGERIRNSIEHALRLASDTMQPPHIRSLGIRLLAHLSWPRSRDLVREILGQPNSPDLQIAAVRSLRSHPNDALEVVFTAWPTMSPPVRRAAIDVMLTRKDRAARLVEKLRAKDIDPSDIDPAESERLLSTCSDGERAELQSLFVRSDIADRQNAVDSYRAAITMQGNHDRGGSLFRRHCMTCHAIQGQGQRVGPDLASVAGRPRERLLVDILDPSREVGSESYNLVVATKDGRVLSGLLASENDRGITLRRAEGIEESISRDHIVQLRSTGKSLMPDGFERTLGAQEVADLLEFIARGEPPQSPQ
jgi:putative heme-binding domain-containing protein